MHQLQRLQRERRSSKRGLRSKSALLQRKRNKQAKRRIHRRQYRWCRSNIRGLADDTLGGRSGTCSHTLVKTTQGPQPLKDARNHTYTRLYEEHRNQNKADLTSYNLPYASMIKVVSFNSRSLLKPTMHKQIIDYMRAHQVHTFMTISTADAQTQEHAGVGYVLCPHPRGALLRTHYVHSRLACVTLLLQSGELSIVNAHAPHSARPEEGRET